MTEKVADGGLDGYMDLKYSVFAEEWVEHLMKHLVLD